MRYRLLLFSICLLMSCGTASNQEKEPEDLAGAQTVRLGFYNVENLFDTTDDPQTKDDEFTPEGSKHWTNRRWQEKNEQLTKVISAMKVQLLGLCEVENEQVVKELVKHLNQAGGHYQYAHRESRDLRGIDMALLYDPSVFKVGKIRQHHIRVNGHPYRGFLEVKGQLHDAPLSLYICHFPSRRGGVKRSAAKRMQVAKQLREAIYQSRKEKGAILVMGDFNDNPQDQSVKAVLCDTDVLVNLAKDLPTNQRGSTYYRGEWLQFDQILYGKSEEAGTKIDFTHSKLKLFAPSWLRQGPDAHQYADYPNRTYIGNRYVGGYSDHFPVFCEIVVQ
ncbi:endonuclease/exonuclease/phosphatase family protein [Persicobacter psychrovividus]|uniref:Endonuclease n=1 Tax=Persicobacter psychrovividus TaxID=387638 RepID=A0ABN6L6X0_9BACT|nr:endonuclease [Persicobacter psychrovividus]